MVPGDVYLVTNQDLMRGYDYRCIDGIALLIGSSWTAIEPEIKHWEGWADTVMTSTLELSSHHTKME